MISQHIYFSFLSFNAAQGLHAFGAGRVLTHLVAVLTFSIACCFSCVALGSEPITPSISADASIQCGVVKAKGDITNQMHLSISFGGSSIEDSIFVIAENFGDDTIRISNIGSFGNIVYALGPNGDIITLSEHKRLPPDYDYKPNFVVKSGTAIVCNGAEECGFAEGLHSLLKSIKEPGRYEIWFDLIDWIDYAKKDHKKYTSNRLIMLVDESGDRTFESPLDVKNVFEKYKVSRTGSNSITTDQSESSHLSQPTSNSSVSKPNKVAIISMFDCFGVKSIASFGVLFLLAIVFLFYLSRRHTRKG